MDGASHRERWSIKSAIALSLACAVWAGSAIAAKVVIGHGSHPPVDKLGPVSLACIRFGVAGLLLLVYLRMTGRLQTLDRSDRRRMTLLGCTGIGVTYAVFYGGMQYTTATETTFLVAAEPILIVVLARALLGERLLPAQAIGMVVGLCGVYVIVFGGVVPRLEGTAVANAIVTLALVFEAYASVIGKALTRRYPGLMVAAYGMLIGSLFLLPGAIFETYHRPAWKPGWPELIATAYLTLLCSCLCYGIWYSLLERHSVSSMSGFLFIQPVLGPIYGMALLGESLSVATAAGAAITLAGVWMIASTRPGQKRDGDIRGTTGIFSMAARTTK